MAWLILAAVLVAAVVIWLLALRRLPRDQRWIGKHPGGPPPP